MNRHRQGFTLIELVIVMAVIAILVAIAFPSFLEQLRASRRSEAIQGLQQIQLMQERYRASNPTYGTLAQIGAPAASENAYYAFTVTGTSATGYTVTATAQNAQASDDKCDTLTLTYAAGTTTKGSTPSGNDCWKG